VIPASLTARSRTGGLRFYLVLASLTTLGPFALDMYLPGLPGLAHELRASESETQVTLTAFLLGLALGQLLVGPLSDAVGRRVPLVASLIVYSIASVLCALSPSIYILIGFRLLQGMAGGSAAVIGTAIVRDLYSGSAAAKFYSLLVLVTLISPLLAPIAGGELLLVTSWRGVFVTLALIGVALLVVVALALPETLPLDRRRQGGVIEGSRPLLQLAVDPVFISYALPAAFGGAALFTYLAGSSFVLERVYGASPQVYGLLFAFNGLALGIASQMNRWLLDRVSSQRLFTVGLAALVAGGIALLATVSLRLPGLEWVVIPVMLMVASNGFIGPNSLALALLPHPKAAGSGAALMGSMRFAFGALMAPVVGLFGSSTAFPLALTMFALSLGAGVAYVTLRPGRLHTNL
jgi:DHA1 family bicyclomycin/chloramphenicol resistance-like MFS transporter